MHDYSRKLKALSEIRDGSVGEITRGYLTVEALLLSSLKMQEKKQFELEDLRVMSL